MKLKFVKIHENAVLPTNANENDVGLDLIAIEKDTTLESGVILYKTGLKVIPEDGYYVEIVPRSSIVKTGWGLANSVGIIDPSYRGELKIALVKTNPLAEEMELPFCKTQLIVRKCYPIITEETSEFDSTSRNSGGFGSTGNRIN